MYMKLNHIGLLKKSFFIFFSESQLYSHVSVTCTNYIKIFFFLILLKMVLYQLPNITHILITQIYSTIPFFAPKYAWNSSDKCSMSFYNYLIAHIDTTRIEKFQVLPCQAPYKKWFYVCGFIFERKKEL